MCVVRSMHRVRSFASFVRASVCSALQSVSVSVSAGDGVGSSKAWPESEYKVASEKHHIETKYREDLMKAGHQRERRERERVRYARAYTRGERERVQGIRTSIHCRRWYGTARRFTHHGVTVPVTDTAMLTPCRCSVAADSQVPEAADGEDS